MTNNPEPSPTRGAQSTSVLLLVGTRPEAIKLAPVYTALSDLPDATVRLCLTGQHRGLLDQVTDVFGLVADHDLDVMTAEQTSASVAAAILDRLTPVLEAENPDYVVVQGDTTTAMAGALAAMYQQIPVAHVEAGLRTYDRSAPFPEEAHRCVISSIADLHFAPTARAAAALLAEGTDPATIHIVGNTIVDALMRIRASVPNEAADVLRRHGIEDGRPLVLLTLHRRENVEHGIAAVCRGVRTLAAAYPDLAFLAPVHPNPLVASTFQELLTGLDNVFLDEPFDYPTFLALLERSRLVISDSGGVQEEAPTLGVPLLIARDKTERPEAVESGSALLVGTNEDRIVREASSIIDAGVPGTPQMLYGDGASAKQIVDVIMTTKGRRATSP
jgi:UDP-N-acetylglucosamine 2-epimerase (non-hydrolysing)